MHVQWEDFNEDTRQRLAAADPVLQISLDAWIKENTPLTEEEIDNLIKETMIARRNRVAEIIKELRSGKLRKR